MSQFLGTHQLCGPEVSRSCRGAAAEVSGRCCRGAADGAPAGPSRPRPGPGLGLGVWKSGDLKIQKFGIKQIKKTKFIKIQICSAQNVGKVWIGREKNIPAPFGTIPGNFFQVLRKSKKCCKCVYFPWWAIGCAILLRKNKLGWQALTICKKRHCGPLKGEPYDWQCI